MRLVIEARQLTKRYGATAAVDQLSFDARPGVVTGFLGPNGSGKSTTMRLILGLDSADAGQARIGGRPAEAHDYHDELSGVLASSLTKRAPGYTSLGFPDPRNLPYTPSAGTKTSQGRKGVQMNPVPDQAGQPG